MGYDVTKANNYKIKITSLAQASYIDNGANFGFGIDSPTAKLHVKSPGITSGTTALLVQNNVGTNLLEVKDDGTSLFSGNVGFGHTAPTFNVHIEDVISSANGFKVGNSTNLRACTINTGGDIDLFDSVGTNAIKLSQGFILNNLGIGLTNPSFNLEVKAAPSSGKGIRVSNTSDGRSCVINTGGAILLKDGSGTSVISISPTADSYFNGGDVGIGISTNPLAKCHVGGRLNVT